jgi:hypothetical protein
MKGAPLATARGRRELEKAFRCFMHDREFGGE